MQSSHIAGTAGSGVLPVPQDLFVAFAVADQPQVQPLVEPSTGCQERIAEGILEAQ